MAYLSSFYIRGGGGIYLLFSFNFQIFVEEHGVYLTLKEFLSIGESTTLGGSKSGVGGGGPVLKHL